MPYGPPLYGKFLGAYFLQIWGVGVVRIVFNITILGQQVKLHCDNSIQSRRGILKVTRSSGPSGIHAAAGLAALWCALLEACPDKVIQQFLIRDARVQRIRQRDDLPNF